MNITGSHIPCFKVIFKKAFKPSVDLVYVACGRFEGFFEYNLKAWDVAAGSFIVQQAGGAVSDFNGGNNFIFGGEIIAACDIHLQMLDIIKANW